MPFQHSSVSGRSVNVCGRKLWRLLPPERAPLLLDRFGREAAPCLPAAGRPCDAAARERFPNLAAAAPHVLTVIQVPLLLRAHLRDGS